MKTRPLINSDRRYKTPEQRNTLRARTSPRSLVLSTFASLSLSLFLSLALHTPPVVDLPFSATRRSTCFGTSRVLTPSPPLHSSAVALSPFVQRLPPERIDPPFPPPCVRPRTPPSAAYKSRVFNYPASTGRITNAHAMENIPRLPLLHARITRRSPASRA